MRPIPSRLAPLACALGAALYACALIPAFTATGHARQARAVSDGVYSADQARRGQQIYQEQCETCHGRMLEGSVGPMLAGEGFLSTWGGRSLLELVDKIHQTMPLQSPGSLSRQQAVDVTAYMLQFGKFPAGSTDLAATALAQVSFPASRSAAAAGAAGAGTGPAFGVAGNLAQLMRAITFPNANILFNVQVKNPAEAKPVRPVPFDYVLWGNTVYYGWQAVDQAALALVESTPLFLLPGRRCENGRPVPIERADYQKYTQALIDISREAYKAAQSRNMDAVAKMSDALNDACANCHKVYRDAAQEGLSAGAERCR
jgi:mono/diheme cytochrome c family protein